MKYKIRLNSVDDAVCMVNELERWGQPVDAMVGSTVVDATSVMGLIYLGVGKTIELMVQGKLTKEVLGTIEKYQVA